MLTECGEEKRQLSRKIYESIRKKVIDTATLIIYDSITHAANSLNLNRRTLSKHLSGKVANITTIVFLKDYIEGQGKRDPDEGRQAIKVIDTLTKIIYNTIKEAAVVLGISKESLSNKLSGKYKNNTYFMYLKDYKEGLLHEPECIIQGKAVIDIITGYEYKNARIASEKLGIKHSTLKGYLNGACKNSTSLRYKENL